MSVLIAKHLGVLANPATKATDLKDRAHDIILYLILLELGGEL